MSPSQLQASILFPMKYLPALFTFTAEQTRLIVELHENVQVEFKYESYQFNFMLISTSEGVGGVFNGESIEGNFISQGFTLDI